jgi:hypothetical protein
VEIRPGGQGWRWDAEERKLVRHAGDEAVPQIKPQARKTKAKARKTKATSGKSKTKRPKTKAKQPKTKAKPRKPPRPAAKKKKK